MSAVALGRPQGDTWAVLAAGLNISVQGANDSGPASAASAARSAAGDWLTPLSDGQRTEATLRRVGHLVALGMPIEEVKQLSLLWNRQHTPPLPVDKVERICESVAVAETRNHPNRLRTRSGLALVPAPVTPLFDVTEAAIGPFLATPPPARRWVLQDFLPLGIAATIVAPGGVGKSQFLMQLGYAVATGTALCGQWPVGEPGSVLMLCAEDSNDEIHRRVDRIHNQLGKAFSSAITANLTQRLFVRSTIGEDTLLTKLGGQGQELMATQIGQRLSMTAAQLSDLKVIILDPASRFRGGDENSNDHGTRFVQALEQIVQSTGATLLIAHHAGKGAANAKEGPSQNDSRGASALTDGVRWQLVLSTVTDKHKEFRALQDVSLGHYVEATLVKTNYTAPQRPVLLRREADGYLQALQGAPAVPAAGGLALMQLMTLLATTSKPLTAKDVEVSYCGMTKVISVAQRASRKLIASARAAGLVQGSGLVPLSLTPAGKAALAQNAAAAGGLTKHGLARPGGSISAAAKRQGGTPL